GKGARARSPPRLRAREEPPSQATHRHRAVEARSPRLTSEQHQAAAREELNSSPEGEPGRVRVMPEQATVVDSIRVRTGHDRVVAKVRPVRIVMDDDAGVEGLPEPGCDRAQQVIGLFSGSDDLTGRVD